MAITGFLMSQAHQGDSSSRGGGTQNDRDLYYGEGEEAAMRMVKLS